jgi:hypothetical protein
MAKGDVLGHEFIGEVVETGADVRRHRIGDRVVVSSFIACGKCWFCDQRLFSLCDNGNTNPAITETMWGYAPGGSFGYSHAMGGNAGSHADRIECLSPTWTRSRCRTRSPTSARIERQARHRTAAQGWGIADAVNKVKGAFDWDDLPELVGRATPEDGPARAFRI